MALSVIDIRRAAGMAQRGTTDRAARLEAIFADEATFVAWYDQVMPRVYGYLFSRCGGDRGLAEELTQQVFVEAVASHDRFDGRAEPVTWLIGIGRHKLADHFRRADRDARRHERLALVEMPSAADPIARADEYDDVRRALEQLPGEQRIAFVLRTVDGLSVRDVAAITRRSEDATESLLRRARTNFDRAIGTTADA
jgi:RNA polymerase sigma-70 factor (ECF subfamily)